MTTEIVVLDTETTGLDTGRDEILEIAIVSGNGETLLNTLVRPVRHTEWPEAQVIHHISPEDVAGAPTLVELADEIREAVEGKIVVIYNAEFDEQLLTGYLDSAADIHCCMWGFSQEISEIEEAPERRHKLVMAAHYAEHDWGQDAAHRAIHDAQATLSVWRWLHRRDPNAYPV